MNDSIEQTMKAWRPARPSPGLRSRIFVAEAAVETEAERPAFDMSAWMRWLVPAVGCFLVLTASVAESDTQARAAGPVSTDRLAYSTMAAGNRDVSQKNTVPATSVERSFGQRSSLKADAFAGSETNTLIK